MPIPVTRTKVIIPRRRADLLSRQRLLDKLYELLDYKLIILTAPAGYGKTSLLVDFAHQSDLPVCWFALDSLDQDPLRFIAHFIAAITQRFPAFGKQSAAALDSTSQTSLDMTQMVSIIVNDAYEHIREHFLLVLDDYHMVNESKKVDQFLNRLVQEIDENCHILMASRSLLSLPDLPLWVARSWVGGLSFEELEFNVEEIQSLILQKYHVTMPDAKASELVKDTEGWITGLLLSAETMAIGKRGKPRSKHVSGVDLYDYLAQQVLDQQPREVRDFLLQTSFLEEFDDVFCRDVFGPSKDWSALINIVLQNNLFILPVGEDGRWIRYHHLFRDFLQNRFEKEKPEEKDALLRNLTIEYAKRGEWEKAYTISGRVDDVQVTANLIEEAGTVLIKTGRMVTLAEWIDALPGEVLATRYNLISLRAVAEIVQGQMEQGLILLNQAARAQRAAGDNPGLARTLARRAVALRFMGRYEDSLSDGGEAMAIAESVDSLRAIQAEALRAIGASLYQMGRLHEAISRYNQSQAVYTSLGDKQNVAVVMMELGLAYMISGHFRQALENYEKALEYWREVQNTVSQANLLNNLGVLHDLMGNYVKSASVFEDALALAKQNKFIRMEAYILCSVGDLYMELDASEAAMEAYQRAWGIARQVDDRFLLFYVCLTQAAHAREMGELAHARSYIESAEQMGKTGNSIYEQGLWQLEAGRLKAAEADFGRAIEHLKAAAQIFEEGGQRVESARAYVYLAAVLHTNQNKAEAFKELQNAFRLAANLESQHVLLVAAKHAATLLQDALEDPVLRVPARRLLDQMVHFVKKIPALRRQLRPHTAAVPFVAPKLAIHSLGWSQVDLDGKPVTAVEWQTQKKAREFFYYMLATKEGRRKEAIGVIIWPESSSAKLHIQFRNAVYRLRLALGQDVIGYDEDRYWFNRNMDYEYDVEVFESRLGQAEAAKKTREKIKAYRAAIEVYKGPYLPEIDATWIITERERIWGLYLNALISLARLHLELNENDKALEYCDKILQEDNCFEEAHRIAMRAFAARGDRAAVTRQYNNCMQALLDELKTKPAPETETLYLTLT
jgi:ATP/maltotriose-dependent transcriptional regulator MalT/DNA-binding SARP family transcriptional activator